MSKKNQIIMSAASVSAALAAVTTMSQQNQIIDTPKATPFDTTALEAVVTAKSQAIIRSSFHHVARTIRLDADLGRAIYAEVAQEGEGAPWWPDPSNPPEEGEEEPEIVYDENGIPIGLAALFSDGGNSDGLSHLQFNTAEELVDLLGLTPPPDQTAEEYMEWLEQTYYSALASDDTLPEEFSLSTLTGGSHLIDSVHAGSNFLCYSNCHAACHGSRGWR